MDMKVLIIEDSPIMRMMLRGLLRQINITDVTETANGAEGINILNQGMVDLILLDLHMPVMDGITFINEINKNAEWAKIPIVIVSSDNETGQIVKALHLGARTYITKPFRIENLESALKVAFSTEK
jgi:two-component system, chemotaxis family, chemotaxis protein CheY